MYIEQRRKPKRAVGFKAWFKRWFLCGIIEERRTMRIYMEIIQVESI
tara:strand:+ start:1110 stop:1250 length:141 start_codon:yes stop_codon:yes gene_type:complete